MAAITNSSRLIRKIVRRPLSTSSTPMRNTTDASTAVGMYCSGLVRKSRTTRTITAGRQARELAPAAPPSTICVLVGLPLTTKVPDSPAPAFARPRPTRSTFSSKGSSYFAAYTRAVAALCASTTTKMAPRSRAARRPVTRCSRGKPKSGSPLGTTPRVETPSAARSSCQLTTMAPTTAMRAPGIGGRSPFVPEDHDDDGRRLTRIVALLLSVRRPRASRRTSGPSPRTVRGYRACPHLTHRHLDAHSRSGSRRARCARGSSR